MGTADRVREILSTRALTLYRVSQRSAEIFGHTSPYFIPQRFYSDLAAHDVSPSIHQLLALSRISDYRLCDWMAVFGFRLDDIPRLQLGLSTRQTVLLDATIYDEYEWTPWFVGSSLQPSLSTIAPLGHLLRPGAPRRARDLLALNKRRFLYAKVGREDEFAFPTLAPGSVARIDVRRKPDLISLPGPNPTKSIFLVENASSLHCGHLRAIDKNRVVLCSTHFPFAQVEIKLGRGVRILGLVDAEIRPFASSQPVPEAGAATSIRSKASASTAAPLGGLQQLLRASRIRTGLSFREASALSRSIAGALADPTYFMAAGTLSDYEHLSPPPRHVQKIVSLCILYCIDFWTFLRAGGLPRDGLGHDPLPDEIIGRVRPPGDDADSTKPLSGESNDFLSILIEEWEELPFFLRHTLPALAQVKEPSLAHIFWVGENEDPVHPCLAGAAFVAVNPRAKTPVQSRARTTWEQPIYILLKRDGTYLCAPCTVQQGVLIVHPHSDRPNAAVRLRSGTDAEVIGQVTAIFRRLF